MTDRQTDRQTDGQTGREKIGTSILKKGAPPTFGHVLLCRKCSQVKFPIISLKIIVGGKQKRVKMFSLTCYAIVPPEVFCETKNSQHLFSPPNPQGSSRRSSIPPSQLKRGIAVVIWAILDHCGFLVLLTLVALAHTSWWQCRVVEIKMFFFSLRFFFRLLKLYFSICTW